MIFGIGTDIFLMSRIAEQSISACDPFLMRAFTENEQKRAKNHSNERIYYASRFSAKEAVYKAISRIGLEFKPGEIEILCDAEGCPQVFLYGATEKAMLQKTKGRYRIFVSISYDTDYANAFALAEMF